MVLLCLLDGHRSVRVSLRGAAVAAGAGQGCRHLHCVASTVCHTPSSGRSNTRRSRLNVRAVDQLRGCLSGGFRLPCCPKAAPEWSGRVRPCGWIRLESVPRSLRSLARVTTVQGTLAENRRSLRRQLSGTVADAGTL